MDFSPGSSIMEESSQRPACSKCGMTYDEFQKVGKLGNDTRIYILSPSSQKLIKLCVEGATISVTDDQFANANLTQSTTMKKNWDTAVATNSIAGMIQLQ
jgi:hypothetical protein